MNIVASCSYEESLKFEGKLCIPSDENSKPDKVQLNIVVSDGDTSILKKLNNNIKCVTFIGDVDFSGLEIPEGKVFREFSLDDDIVEYENVVPLLRVPKNYSDMRTLQNICNKYPSLRIIGGNLLNIDGVRIGRYSVGKDKGSPVYNGIYDNFLEVPLNGIDNLTEIKKARKKLENNDTESKKGKSSKPKKPVAKKSNISKAFTSLFSDSEEDF